MPRRIHWLILLLPSPVPMKNNTNVVTRFAPSPTGFLHIGGIRTALFAYLLAKKNNGTFILRIEDTDKERQVEGSIEHIKESLSWLGIEWEYGPDTPGPFGPCIQSERLDIYKSYAKQLVDKGLAYPDTSTPEEIVKQREACEKTGGQFLFRNHRPEHFVEWDEETTLRLKVTDLKKYTWEDAVWGHLEGGGETLDDIVLIKADGFPTYNFAHIVDDHEMGVTHLMRGDEFISSTPRFLSIYEALGIPHPIFVSLPPILNESGSKKLSKRDGAKDILDYKREGYLSETLINFLALIGWNPGTEKELFTLTELITEFSIDNIQRSGGSFNIDKLKWMNKMHYQKLTDETYLKLVKEFVPEKFSTDVDAMNSLKRALPILRERIEVMNELPALLNKGELSFITAYKKPNDTLLPWKKDADPKAWKARLDHASSLLNSTSFDSEEEIKLALWDYIEAEGKGEVLWPLRVALTGLERSPDPFSCAYILGKEESIRRIDAVLE